jgi:hypothetical protein
MAIHYRKTRAFEAASRPGESEIGENREAASGPVRAAKRLQWKSLRALGPCEPAIFPGAGPPKNFEMRLALSLKLWQ